MSTNKFMRDNYQESFNSMSSLLERLQELEKESIWIKDAELNDLRVYPLRSWDELPVDIKMQSTMERTVVEDTIQHSGYYLILPDGTAYCLREQGVASVHCRAGITGSAYGRLPKDICAKHLNDGLSVVEPDKVCCIRIEGGKILGVHSSDYNPFSMFAAYSEVQEWLSLQYPEAKLIRATMNHDGVISCFDFSAYGEELFSDLQGLFYEAKLTPTLEISMGDSAKASVSISPKLISGFTPVPLGAPIQNKHRGTGDQMKRFQQALLEVEGQFERKLINLKNLSDISITYPVDCFLNMSAQIGLLKMATKATKRCAEMFNIMMSFPERKEITALDVYLGMCEVISYVENEAAGKGENKEAAIAKISSTVARALKSNWKANDFPNLDTIKGGE